MIWWLAFLLMAALAVCRADKALLVRAFGGDRAAQATLNRRLLPVIYSRVQRVLRRRRVSDAKLGVDDVAQQVWVTLLKDDGRQLLNYDPERGKSLEGWIGMVSEREAGNALAQVFAEKRDPGLESPPEALTFQGDGTPSPESAAEARDMLERLMGYLDDELAERGRVILRLLYVDQVSTREAAEALGVSQQVVWNWQHKIRTLARRFAQQQVST